MARILRLICRLPPPRVSVSRLGLLEALHLNDLPGRVVVNNLPGRVVVNRPHGLPIQYWMLMAAAGAAAATAWVYLGGTRDGGLLDSATVYLEERLVTLIERAVKKYLHRMRVQAKRWFVLTFLCVCGRPM